MIHEQTNTQTARRHVSKPQSFVHLDKMLMWQSTIPSRNKKQYELASHLAFIDDLLQHHPSLSSLSISSSGLTPQSSTPHPASQRKERMMMMMKKKKKEEEEEVKENPNLDLERCCSVSVVMNNNGCDSKWEAAAANANGMVKIEIDAARALADFAQLALLETSAVESSSDRKWGNKRKRSKKLFINKTSVPNWGTSSSNLESFNFNNSVVVDLVQRDHSIEAQPWDKKLTITENFANIVKAEHDSELPTTTPMYPTNFVPSSGGKSKQQHLTEAEKEARRLRRVLANRESARQTIRRRQAMHEELAKKATHLELDNESMKREKVVAMKEYRSLKDKNKYLKLEMARKIKYEAEETHKETSSTTVEASASSEKLSLLGYNGPPFTPIPFIWPPIIQPFNPVQTQPITKNCTTSLDPAVANDNSNPSQEQGNPLRTNGPRTPFYIVPYPWFFPLPDHGNQLRPHPFPFPLDTGRIIKQDDGSVVYQHITAPSSKSTEKGFCTTEEHLSNDLSKASTELPTNERGRLSGAHRDGVILMSAPVAAPIRSVKHEKSEDCVQPDSTCKKESHSSSSTSGYVPENKRESDTNACTKLVDATTAAEARKRRKELTKLKNYNTRQPRLRC